jgi:hypothetical protein
VRRPGDTVPYQHNHLPAGGGVCTGTTGGPPPQRWPSHGRLGCGGLCPRHKCLASGDRSPAVGSPAAGTGGFCGWLAAGHHSQLQPAEGSRGRYPSRDVTGRGLLPHGCRFPDVPITGASLRRGPAREERSLGTFEGAIGWPEAAGGTTCARGGRRLGADSGPAPSLVVALPARVSAGAGRALQ